MAYRVVDALTGKEVLVGETIRTFRGEEFRLIGFTPKPPPSTGRVEVQDLNEEFGPLEYYPGVFQLRIEEITS